MKTLKRRMCNGKQNEHKALALNTAPNSNNSKAYTFWGATKHSGRFKATLHSKRHVLCTLRQLWRHCFVYSILNYPVFNRRAARETFLTCTLIA